MTITKKYFLFVLFVLVCAVPVSGLALTLDEAKAGGLVGEQPDGYLGIVAQSAEPGVIALVADINNRRREKYQQIARDTGADLSAVEVIAGKKAIERSEPGHFILLPSVRWIKKE